MLLPKSKLSFKNVWKFRNQNYNFHSNTYTSAAKFLWLKESRNQSLGKRVNCQHENVRTHRVITQHVISRNDPEPNAAGPTVVVSFRIRVLACLSRLSIAPANRAMRTDRFAIHVEHRGSGVAAQCSRIIYADDVETIPCSYVRCTHVRRSK